MNIIQLCRMNEDISEEIAAVKRVLESKRYVKGQEAINFAKEFAGYLGIEKAITCSSGTAALYAIAIHLKSKKYKMRVTIPALSFWATAQAFLRAGCDVRVADVHEDTLLMDYDTAPKGMKVLVHLYGNLCEPPDQPFVEDACQAHGAMYKNGKPAGGVGDYAAFSFFPSKNMSVCGEGGMIIDNKGDFRDDIVDNGRNTHQAGLNMRMSEISAAIGRISLSRLEDNVEKRNELAHIYDAYFTTSMKIKTTSVTDRHARHLYVIRLSSKTERNNLADILRGEGIECGIHYPYTLNELRGLEHYECPVAEQACGRILSLPLSMYHTPDEIKRICEIIK